MIINYFIIIFFFCFQQLGEGFTNRYDDAEIMELCSKVLPPERVQVNLKNVSVCSETRAQTREFNTVFQSMVEEKFPQRKFSGT